MPAQLASRASVFFCSSSPILFGFPLHGRRLRVLELEPVLALATTIDRTEPFRHNAFAAHQHRRFRYGQFAYQSSTHNARLARQSIDFTPEPNGFGATTAVLPGIPVSLRWSRRLATVQSTPAVRHRGRLTRLAGPLASRMASGCQMHGQGLLVHGVVRHLCLLPLPLPSTRCRRPPPDRHSL